MSAPFLLLTLVFKSKQLVDDATDDVQVFLPVFAFTVALIGVLTAWLLGRQKRRASGFPGALWFSRFATYAGPYDEFGDTGLRGSADFASRHRANTVSPIVRLVLTSEAIAIVPMNGRNRPLLVPLPEVARVDVVHGDRKTNGIKVTTSESRSASFLVKPDDGLVLELQRLGAVVERAH